MRTLSFIAVTIAGCCRLVVPLTLFGAEAKTFGPDPQVNTIMASVRARRWELGVLRALGITRWAMFRMILAEGLLIGMVACVVSLAFGVMAGWCGTGISQYVSFFGGMATPLVVPWSKLALGFSVTLALCLTAALWPAISTGRTDPLRLLQEGRAAM